MIKLAAVLAIALFAGSFGDDVTLLQQELPAIHPHVDTAAFNAAAAQLATELATDTEEQAVVGFMKLVASLGNRNGHTGIFPLDPGNERAFHEYPYLVYEFADGVYVTGQMDGSDLVGARLTAIGGVPIDDVLAQVKPLVPHDNETTGIALFRPMYLLNEEVLAGLGITPTFDFTLPNGDPVERTPAAVSAGAYSQAFGGLGFRMWPNGSTHARDRNAATRISLLKQRRVVYLAYNTTTVSTRSLGSRVARLASKPRVRRVVIDLRNNLGGDNNTYGWLIDTLQRLAHKKHKRIVVLAGRDTFSAAANFMADLEARCRYLLVGEDSGGAPNLYGDVAALDLPETGLRVEIATIWWVKSKLGPNDPRVTFHPDVVVPPTATAWFAGRDPALQSALYAPFSKAHKVH